MSRCPGGLRNQFEEVILIYILQIDPNADIEVLDIPVNAVATALKDFFSKHLPPLFDKDLMTELEEIAGKFHQNVYPANLDTNLFPFFSVNCVTWGAIEPTKYGSENRSEQSFVGIAGTPE